MPRRWYWKLYLLLTTLLTIGGIGLSFYFSEELTSIDHIAEWAALPMYLVQLVGLFGFVYGRRFGSALLWKLVFAVTILDLLWAGYSLFIDGAAFANTVGAVFAFIMAAIYLPLLAALYIYAFRSNNLWARAQDQANTLQRANPP